MFCPLCKNQNTKVLDSRTALDGKAIRRRRQCSSCNFRFTTYEKISTTSLIVDKKSEEREQFDREKLFSSLKKACSKLMIDDLKIDSLVTKIEGTLISTGKDSVSSFEIGQIAVKELKNFNSVAYVRYASVFSDVVSLKQFESLVDSAKERESKKGGSIESSQGRKKTVSKTDKNLENAEQQGKALKELYETPTFIRENEKVASAKKVKAKKGGQKSKPLRLF